MNKRRRMRSGAAWLELLLALAIILLLFQLFPSVPERILSGLDFRQWTRSTWFLLNAAILILLVAVRIGPTLVDQWKSRQTSKPPASAAAPVVVDRSEDVRVLMRRDEEARARQRRKLALYGLLAPLAVVGLAAMFVTFRSGQEQRQRRANTLLHSNPGSDLRRDVSGVVGIPFVVRPDRTFTVTHLGVFDSGGNGLQHEYRVGLFGGKQGSSSKTQLIAETIVPYGRHATLEGGFRWVALAKPILLESNSHYVLAAETFGGWYGRGKKDEHLVADSWPATFDEAALQINGSETAWNPVVIGEKGSESHSLLITDNPWPAYPDREEAVAGPAFGPANLIVTESQ